MSSSPFMKYKTGCPGKVRVIFSLRASGGYSLRSQRYQKAKKIFEKSRNRNFFRLWMQIKIWGSGPKKRTDKHFVQRYFFLYFQPLIYFHEKSPMDVTYNFSIWTCLYWKKRKFWMLPCMFTSPGHLNMAMPVYGLIHISWQWIHWEILYPNVLVVLMRLWTQIMEAGSISTWQKLYVNGLNIGPPTLDWNWKWRRAKVTRLRFLFLLETLWRHVEIM